MRIYLTGPGALIVVLASACSQPEPPAGTAGVPVPGPAASSVAIQAASEPAADSSPPTGEQLYIEHCQQCHEGKVAKAPPRSLLGIMSASSVYNAIETGIMRTQAEGLDSDGRRVLAEYLTNQKIGASSTPPRMCAEGESPFDFSAQPDAAGWGVDRRNQRHVSAEVAGLTKADIPKLRLKWAFRYPDAVRGRSQPATAGGGLFVGSQNGSVYSLDQKSGCVRWIYKTAAEVRTGIIIEPWAEDAGANHPQVFFGDLIGNVHSVDAVTGELVWKHRPSDHPSLTLTAAPVLREGRLYVPLSALEVTAAADPTYACCTFSGGVAAYDAASGELLWTGYTLSEPPRVVGKTSAGTDRIAPSGSPVWGTPTIDEKRQLIYVGTGENYSSPPDGSSDAIIALDLADGKIVWTQQMTAGDAWNMACESENQANCPPEDGPDYDFGAATILVTNSAGKDLLLAGQKSGEVFALDPDRSGEIIWRKKLGRGGIQGGVHFGMAVNGEVLYVPISDFEGGDRWPGEPHPGMYALDVNSGALLWSTPAQDICEGRTDCQPGLSAAASSIPGAVFSGAMDGHLRAYDSATGAVLWDYDTAREYQTLSGETGFGGSLGGAAGPVFKDGMLYVNSGYGIYFHMPGNVLLAFAVANAEEKPVQP
jgi:polyvinyl alcohol dehydrogenase (cytochrome)